MSGAYMVNRSARNVHGVRDPPPPPPPAAPTTSPHEANKFTGIHCTHGASKHKEHQKRALQTVHTYTHIVHTKYMIHNTRYVVPTYIHTCTYIDTRAELTVIRDDVRLENGGNEEL